MRFIGYEMKQTLRWGGNGASVWSGQSLRSGESEALFESRKTDACAERLSEHLFLRVSFCIIDCYVCKEKLFRTLVRTHYKQ